MLGIIFLVFAISIDTFVASLAYGLKKIKIPISSVIVMNIISVSLLGVGLWGGSVIQSIVEGEMVEAIGAGILILIGMYQLLDSMETSSADSYLEIPKQKVLGLKESLILGFVLSVDGLVVGIGMAMGDVNSFVLISIFGIINVLATVFGIIIGNKISQNTKLNISWISPVILISLGLFKYITAIL